MKNTQMYSLPIINQSRLALYASENPDSLLSVTFTKSERQRLRSLGASEHVIGERFNVLGTSSAKTEKGETKGWLTGICYLSPSTESGFANLCLWAGNCRSICLNTAGRGRLNSVQKARQRKTFRLCRYGFDNFLLNAALDILKLLQRVEREGFEGLAVRLDGTSDLGLVNYPIPAFGNRSLAEVFPTVRFYEYTKSSHRMLAFLAGEMPQNVHLTFSHDGRHSVAACKVILASGGNVAVCIERMVPTLWGFDAINGDESDLRFLDKSNNGRGLVVGLLPKGKAKKAKSTFVVLV